MMLIITVVIIITMLVYYRKNPKIQNPLNEISQEDFSFLVEHQCLVSFDYEFYRNPPIVRLANVECELNAQQCSFEAKTLSEAIEKARLSLI